MLLAEYFVADSVVSELQEAEALRLLRFFVLGYLEISHLTEKREILFEDSWDKPGLLSSILIGMPPMKILLLPAALV